MVVMKSVDSRCAQNQPLVLMFKACSIYARNNRGRFGVRMTTICGYHIYFVSYLRVQVPTVAVVPGI